MESYNQQIKDFCKNISTIRRKRGLSEEEMAKRLHISERSLALIEKEILPSRLSTRILFIIKQEFGIKPQEMFSPLEIDKT